MRIRSIRPEFWSSEDVAAMDWHTRLVFIGLWSYVDDNGVGRDVDALIVAALFPLDGDLPESSRRVTGALRDLSEGGQIARYRVDGKAYLFVNSWTKHQRIEKASAGRYPLPTSENAEFREGSGSTPGALREPSTPGEGEKGRRGEGDKNMSDVPSDESPPVKLTLLGGEPDTPTGRGDYSDPLFAEFWKSYPRKDAKPEALKAWRQVTIGQDGPKVPPGYLVDAVRRYTFPADRKFTPLPATWLRGQRWLDEGAFNASTADGAPRKLFPWDM